MLWAEAALAVETQWRFDGTVSEVTGTWFQHVAIGVPVRGLIVVDRDQPFVQIGDPCDGEGQRIFHSVRATKFIMTGASGSGTTAVPPGVDCAPAGLCDVTVDILNLADPPACITGVFQVTIDAGPLLSPELGLVDLAIDLLPSVLPPAAFFATIPESPWAAAPDELLGRMSPSGVPNPQEGIQLALTSLVRAPLCGDIDLDLVVNATDVSLLRAELADPTGAPLPAGGASRCSVIGGLSDCDVTDVVVLRRALAGPPALGPGIQQVCAVMHGG
jgi:hypothetical protein